MIAPAGLFIVDAKHYEGRLRIRDRGGLFRTDERLYVGGRDRSLRVTGTFAALERLRGAGFVTEREARLLEEAYTLLRTMEHRIQWQSGIQTHELPTSDGTLAMLARSLGMKTEQTLTAALDRARSVHGVARFNRAGAERSARLVMSAGHDQDVIGQSEFAGNL